MKRVELQKINSDEVFELVKDKETILKNALDLSNALKSISFHMSEIEATIRKYGTQFAMLDFAYCHFFVRNPKEDDSKESLASFAVGLPENIVYLQKKVDAMLENSLIQYSEKLRNMEAKND